MPQYSLPPLEPLIIPHGQYLYLETQPRNFRECFEEATNPIIRCLQDPLPQIPVRATCVCSETKKNFQLTITQYLFTSCACKMAFFILLCELINLLHFLNNFNTFFIKRKLNRTFVICQNSLFGSEELENSVF